MNDCRVDWRSGAPCLLLLSIINCSCGSRTDLSLFEPDSNARAIDHEIDDSENTGGSPTANQPNPSVVDDTPPLPPVDAPDVPPPVAATPLPVEDWMALFSVEDQLWAVSASGTVLNWKKSTWPLNETNCKRSSISKVALTDVWAGSGTNVWIVSEDGGLFHGDGSTWKREDVDRLDNRQGLNGIWGSSSTDIWAVGDAGTLIHFDGSTWTPFDSGTNVSLVQVLGTSNDDVLALGPGTALRFDGIAWSPFTSTNPDWHLGTKWQDLLPGPDNSLFLIGYWSVSGYKGGGGGTNSFVYDAGQITQELSLSTVGWVTPGGKVIQTSQCPSSTCNVSLEESAEPGDSLRLNTRSETTDLWGDAQWIWGVGKDGLIIRIETPQW